MLGCGYAGLEGYAFARKITGEFEGVAWRPNVYTEPKTNEVLTPPKAKLLFTARLKC